MGLIIEFMKLKRKCLQVNLKIKRERTLVHAPVTNLNVYAVPKLLPALSFTADAGI